MALERLDKLVAAQGRYSRADVRELTRSGRLRINGVTATRGDTKLDPGRDTLELDGVPLVIKTRLYLALNKPAGVVSASEGRGERTVVDLVPPKLSRPGLFPVGRLDKDPTGLLIISDDGGFAHRVLSPKNHVPKSYVARLDRPVDAPMEAAFADGIPLKEGRCLPAQLAPLADCRARVTIREGMYHQIKRMFACCGAHVLTLERVSFGGLRLDALGLMPGECRELTPDELALCGQTVADLWDVAD